MDSTVTLTKQLEKAQRDPGGEGRRAREAA